MRYKSVNDFDSDYDYYDYLDSLTTNKEDEIREPEEEVPEYHAENDRNFPANVSRWENW